MLTKLVLNHRSANLSTEEHAVLRAAMTEVREYGPKELVIIAGHELDASLLLLEGFMGRFVDDPGDSRHMMAFHVAGDFVDLHGYPLKRLDHDVRTLTSARAAVLPHEKLDVIQRQHPRLALKLWYLTMLDAAMHRQWIIRIGRLRALGRVAHALCETNARLFAVGLSDGVHFELPLRQVDFAAVCGLTGIHFNRVIRELRERGLATFRHQVVDIHDLPALVQLGEFQADYLYLNPDTAKRVMGQSLARGGMPA
ncbi:MAG: Crp/Fnr family transcriptional regulator [Pseudomonadota bacterium]|nr:Crp/Fnr family transcriptional regulator [Pseudomonadota bacterium]